MEQNHSWETSQDSHHFTELDGSLPCCQTADCILSWMNPVHTSPISARFISILFSHLRLGLPDGLFSGLAAKILHAISLPSRLPPHILSSIDLSILIFWRAALAPPMWRGGILGFGHSYKEIRQKHFFSVRKLLLCLRSYEKAASLNLKVGTWCPFSSSANIFNNGSYPQASLSK